ncbi:MAG: fatty-acyl-CoA synthase [Candidatus Poriferisodalaceae bacterium]|jgi:fatty-acyl-CoA synthase
MISPNVPEWTFVQLSAALAGLVLVTVNPILRPNEISYVLEQSESVGAGPCRGQDIETIVTELQADLGNLREIIPLRTWAEFTANCHSVVELPTPEAHDPVMIQYTSGTTGLPKGAALSHFGLVNSAMFVPERLERQAGEVWLNPLPMFHTGGCVMGTLGAMASFGAQIMVADFDPALVLQLIEEERPTYALGVPTMVLAVLEHPDFATRDTSSLEVFSSGETTVPPALVERIEAELGVTYNMVMGQTESSGTIFMSRLDSTTYQKSQTVGVPLNQWETMIAGDDNQPVPVGTQGEICCRGWGVTIGYHNMPEATAEAIDTNGWLHTGDLGEMDADGYTRITGRIKDMIIRGGENLFPREIEDALSTHPCVAEAAVIGVPDEKWGEQPVAFIRPDGPMPTDADLAAFLRERIAPHKVPRQWFPIQEFPLNASGKIQKFLLRERYDADTSAHAGMSVLHNDPPGAVAP